MLRLRVALPGILLLALQAPMVPPNDDCASATVLTLGPWNRQMSFTLDTSEATASPSDPIPSCGDTLSARTVWFRFKAPYIGILTVDTTGTEYQHRYVSYGALASGCPNTGDPKQCATNTWEGRLFVQRQMAKGEDLSIGISAAPGDAGGILRVSFDFSPSSPIERLVLGYGPTADAVPGFSVLRYRGHAPSFPLSAHASCGGPVDAAHPAVGDLYGDGEDDVVLGGGRGGNGELVIRNGVSAGCRVTAVLRVPWEGSWALDDGATYPAVGNIDSDPLPEIVVGLGRLGMGYFYVFDDASTGFAGYGPQAGWYRVPWDAYNAGADGSVRPAIADTNGDGIGEVVLGLGQGSQGFLAVLNGPDLSLRTWLQVWWPGYNALNGETFPAAGDIDNDGRGEVVIGLGPGGQGFTEVKGDETEWYWDIGWLTTGWPQYDDYNGETHPAVGNVDGDPASEIIIGLGLYPDPSWRTWVKAIDDATTGFALLQWLQDNRFGPRATFPAVGILEAPAR